jgi:hypothetical protein
LQLNVLNQKVKDKGKFLIGVQSVTCDKEINIIDRSAIAWSDSGRHTHNNPFGVRVE